MKYANNEIECVHLELTSRCNAACPMCPRNINGGAVNPDLPISDLSLDDIKIIFSNFEGSLKPLNRFLFCGNYGDPIVVPYLLDVIAYLKSMRPDAVFGIHTNGSLRTTEWWRQLAHVLPPRSYVTFSIDGLADTNHLYRRNTVFSKIIENAKTFIDAGGTARWDYLVFGYNGHQVDDARKLSENMGFESFNSKITIRFGGKNEFPVKDKNGEKLYSLVPYRSGKAPNLTKNYLDGLHIDCATIRDKSVYVSAEGLVFPCCYTGNIYNGSKNDRSQIWKRINDAGGKDAINAKLRPIDDIITGPFFDEIMSGWVGDRLYKCAKICGKQND